MVGISLLLQTVADSVAIDSVAVEVGTQVGSLASGLVVAGLGFLVRYSTQIGKFVLKAFGTVPAWGKAAVALLFAEGASFLNARYGIPLDADINAIVTSLGGIAIWLSSMGWHSLIKLLPTKEEPAPTE